MNWQDLICSFEWRLGLTGTLGRYIQLNYKTQIEEQDKERKNQAGATQRVEELRELG